MIPEKQNRALLNWEIVSVNPNDKNWSWKDLFCFWGTVTQSIIGFSLIASIYLVYDLSIFVVLSATLFASILVFLFCNLIGKPSQNHGLPFSVILRTSMGVSGAKYIAMIRGFVGIFMFGVQTFFISKSIGYLIRIGIFNISESILDNDIFLIFFMGLNIIDGIAFLLTLYVQFLLFSKGQKLHRVFIKFSAIFVYFGLLLFLIVIISEHYQNLVNTINLSLNYDQLLQKKNIIPLISITGTIFAYYSIVILNYGDFSRYVETPEHMVKGNLSLLLNIIIFSFFSIMIVLGSDVILASKNIEIKSLLTNPTDIIGKFDNAYLAVIALIFILFSSSSTNLIANYVPSQNTLINLIPDKLSTNSAGLVILFFGLIVGLFWLPVLSQIGILSIIDTLGAFFGPMFGIIIVDYYYIKKQTINNKDIYSLSDDGKYYYSNGWQIKGVYSLLIGFIFAASTIWNINLIAFQSFSWIIGGLVSSLVYYLLASK